MTEHTPGPWQVTHSSAPDWTGDWYIYGGAQRRRLIVIAEGWDDEDKANARLIAAAPDLLEALRKVGGLLVHYDIEHTKEAIEIIKDTIRKVEETR